MLESKTRDKIDFDLFQMKWNGETEETSQSEENELLRVF